VPASRAAAFAFWMSAACAPTACALFVCAAAAAAQQAAPPATAPARADSLAHLARLDTAVAAADAPAATWHARGLLAWQLARGMRRTGARVDQEQLRLNRAADSSLVRAVTLEPANVRYLVDFATYRSQGSPIVRGGATRYIRRAFEAARAQGDSLALAQMADQLGMLAFREYQAFFGRRMSLNNGPGSSLLDILGQQAGARSSWAWSGRGNNELGRILADRERANTDRAFGSTSSAESAVRELIESRSVPVGGDPPPGVLAYDESLEYFEMATAAAPALPLPWRHRFAALADRRRWEELSVAAQARLGIAPWDPDAWLALGLGRHRSAKDGASTAFDSAFALMTPQTRAHLDRVERVMRPTAARALDSLPPDDRARTVRFVWSAADPLWSAPGNEARDEYLARVAFAQLRFSDEDQRVHGVDTYPGDLHLRYGFPKVTANWSCAGAQAEADSPDSPNQVCWLWWFAPRLQFIVHYQPVFNRFRFGFDDIAITQEMQEQAPAVWTDIPGAPRVDSIPLRVARFRADGQHPSVLVTGAVPLSRISVEGVRAQAPLARLWMFADGAVSVTHDSVRATDTGLAAWKARVPDGDLYARAEAVTEGGGAARGTVFAPAVGGGAGLAMSDVVVAAAIADGASRARRWHELSITPAPDTLSRSRGFALAWETYQMSEVTGRNSYTVRLTLEKASRSVAGRIVAQIGGLVGVQRGADRVTLEYQRSSTPGGTTVDHVALSLREAPAGRYALTVQVTDAASGARASRTVPLQIAP
jgi:GWxTD domain-containing protein